MGQVGNDGEAVILSPVQVKDPTGKDILRNIVKVRAGPTFSMALAKDGRVYTWGGNAYGQLGNATNENSKLPVSVVGGDTHKQHINKIVSIAAAGLNNHGYAVARGYAITEI